MNRIKDYLDDEDEKGEDYACGSCGTQDFRVCKSDGLISCANCYALLTEDDDDFFVTYPPAEPKVLVYDTTEGRFHSLPKSAVESTDILFYEEEYRNVDFN